MSQITTKQREKRKGKGGRERGMKRRYANTIVNCQLCLILTVLWEFIEVWYGNVHLEQSKKNNGLRIIGIPHGRIYK